MIPYVIRQGDHLPKLAARLGFDADAVWNHPKNDGLRARRCDWHMLCPTDILYVPDSTPPRWLPVRVGHKNQFVATVPSIKIRATFCQGGKRLANVACTVHGLPAPNELTTDGNGTLAFDAPVTLESVTVEFSKPHLVQQLRIGHLDPIEEPSGVYQRLKHLGIRLPSGPMPASFDAISLGLAVKVFQNAEGLPETGNVDDATRERLKEKHGC